MLNAELLPYSRVEGLGVGHHHTLVEDLTWLDGYGTDAPRPAVIQEDSPIWDPVQDSCYPYLVELKEHE